jgi:hypothetical protein
MSKSKSKLLIAALALVTAAQVHAEMKQTQHPFMLWTRDEAAAIRRRIESEDWAKGQYAALQQEKGDGKTLRTLFAYLVMGDTTGIEAEKKYLLSLIGNDPRKFKGDTGGGRHYDQYLHVLRYDALYDKLGEAERAGLESTFRDFIKHYCEEETLKFTRTSWLPNMQWPRPMTAHLMAVALRDEALIRQCFNSNGGWKYYFDDYLADGRFYCEEFGKQYSMIGEMFLWCRGVERLGLDELGFGYVGKNGATMRKTLESIIDTGYPRTDIPGGMPQYPQITMGDARGSNFNGAPPFVFQKSIVTGFLPNGTGGNAGWMNANMNGRDNKNAKVDKMLAPHWFELAHAKWPDAHFDYFLAQMRRPGEAKYTPSLYWGLQPIDPGNVAPPPAPSYVARERGFAFLRAEESPAYWESPAPAVAFQQATYYVHYAHDAFCLLGFHAFNRPIYLNRQISNGYGGGCPWTDSPRGLCGVIVDNLHYELDEADPKHDHPHWPNPIGRVPIRSAFTPLVKYVSANAVPLNGQVDLDNRQPLAGATLSLDLRREEKEVWPGVNMSRALFLTREYLFDVYRLDSDKPHRYDWQVHKLGFPDTDATWTATDALSIERLYDLKNRAVAKLLADPIERERYVLKNVKQLAPEDRAWNATILQGRAPQIAEPLLGNEWYARKIGVRVHMLGETGTKVYLGSTPEPRSAPGREPTKGGKGGQANEVGGTTLMVSRECPKTLFVALHEPFENNSPRVTEFRRVQQTEKGIAVAITGQGINDRVCYSHWGAHDQPLTLAGDGESVTFSDFALIRISADAIEVGGNVLEFTVKSQTATKLLLNDKEASARFEAGVVKFKAP